MSAVQSLPGAATREAAHWHAVQRAGGLDQAQQARFMDWLLASPVHLREYLAVARVAGELGEVLRDMDLDLDALLAGGSPSAGANNVVTLPQRRGPAQARSARGAAPRRRWPRLAAAMLVVACAGAVLWTAMPRTTHYVADHGATRRFTLPDHTVVHLNASSALSARVGWFSREVRLERGQASFEVASDRRPFSVQVDGMEVRDIGTTFDVSVLPGHTRVDVIEGRVRVIDHAGQGRMLADLVMGQRARIGSGDRVVSVTQEDVDTMTAWWQRRVVFRDTPLREVIAQFNRLNTTQLQVDDARAGALRLTGNLQGDDLASLRAFLKDQPTLQLRQATDTVHIASRTATPTATRR